MRAGRSLYPCWGTMADNKRQHYVPNSTLRYFALDLGANPKPRQIRLVNIASQKVIPSASLKGQCYRDYFYGKNLAIEKALGDMEGHFANLIRKMLTSRSIDERDGWHLIQMVALCAATENISSLVKVAKCGSGILRLAAALSLGQSVASRTSDYSYALAETGWAGYGP